MEQTRRANCLMALARLSFLKTERVLTDALSLLAGREGFEPSVDRSPQRFSRPSHSTTLAPSHVRRTIEEIRLKVENRKSKTCAEFIEASKIDGRNYISDFIAVVQVRVVHVAHVLLG